MKDENELFDMLLPLEAMSSLYLEIGRSICTDIDLSSCSYNIKALENTLVLLDALNFISKTEDNYVKVKIYDKKNFQLKFKGMLFSTYKDIIFETLEGKQQYDIENKKIYILRNRIPLKYAGFFMLLGDLNEVRFDGNKVIIIGSEIGKLFIQQKNTRKITLDVLEKRLLREKELGEEAEQFILEYEKEKLIQKGITIEPIQVSIIDVTAGFDILSYFSNNANDEKYIEVKSCDRNYTFYISENEIKKSKEKKDSYFLYLFNRFERTIKEVQNPYRFYFEENNENWVVQHESYKIHKI